MGLRYPERENIVTEPDPTPPADPQPPTETVESLMEKLTAATAEAEKWKGFSRTHEDRAKANAEAAEVRDRFAALGKEMKMQVTVTRQEVFDAMHTI